MTVLVKKADKDQPDQPITEKEAVHKLIDREIVARKRTSGNRSYSQERPKIGRCAAEVGNRNAERKYQVPESMIRNFKRQYLSHLKSGKPTNKIEKHPQARLLKLSALDSIIPKFVYQMGAYSYCIHVLLVIYFVYIVFFTCIIVSRYSKNLSASGSPINLRIVLATAHGVAKYYKPTSYDCVSQHLTDSWARSIMDRMHLVKRKSRLL